MDEEKKYLVIRKIKVNFVQFMVMMQLLYQCFLVIKTRWWKSWFSRKCTK